MNVRRALADSPGGARHRASTAPARRRRGHAWRRPRKGVAAVTSTALVAGALVAAGVALSDPAQAASGVSLPSQAAWSYSNKYTGTATITGELSFDKDSIYVAAVSSPLAARLSPDDTGFLASWTPVPEVTGVNAPTNSGFAASQMATTAFDSGGEDKRRQPTRYFWHFNAVTPTIRADVIDNAPPPGSSYRPVYSFIEDGNTPDRVYFVPQESGWSGGEVDQNTGYLYFTGNYTNNIESNFQMLIFDPVTGKYNLSGLIQPDKPSDKVTGDPASDMALDAAGNAYLIVNGSSQRLVTPSGKVTTAATQWLIKVTPAAPGKWTYSRVVPLFQDTTGNGLGDSSILGSGHWGMAFHNGQLYYTSGTGAIGNGTSISRVDPLTGTVTVLKPGTTASTPYDLTSGQPAAVLNGTVYNDANADGDVGADEVGVSGQTVVLYDDKGKVIGSQITNDSGSYSFLLASRQSAYYVRLAQPVVNEANAVQTFGKGSTLYDRNEVVQMSRGVAGTGSPKAPYVDPVPDAWGQTTDLGTIAAYAKVTINSGADLVTQDFGISVLGSYGDAPAPYRSMTLQKGPQGIESPAGSGVRMGAQRGMFADGSNLNDHASDDGVTLTVNGEQLPLDNQILVSGKEYPLNVALAGDGVAKARVNAWLSPVNSGDTGTFPATPTASTSPLGSHATLNLTPSGVPTGGLSSMWLRVNASTNTDITAPDNSTGEYAPTAGSAASNTQKWTSDGETEDYKLYQASAVVRIAVQNDLPGTFEFSNLTNVSPNAPSSTTDSIEVTTKDDLTYSGRVHAVQDAQKDVVITISAVPEGDVLQSAKIVDTITGAVISETEASGTTFTIPSSALLDAGDVTLQLEYAATPVLTINQAQGMVDPTLARDLKFTLTSSVPLERASVTESSFDLDAAPVEGVTFPGSVLNPRVVSIEQLDQDRKVFEVVVRVDDSATVTIEVPAGRVLTPDTGLTNKAATWNDNKTVFLNPLQVSPPRFTLVTGEPNGKDYSILIRLVRRSRRRT